MHTTQTDRERAQNIIRSPKVRDQRTHWLGADEGGQTGLGYFFRIGVFFSENCC
jgi:hypothetical protein